MAAVEEENDLGRRTAEQALSAHIAPSLASSRFISSLNPGGLVVGEQMHAPELKALIVELGGLCAEMKNLTKAQSDLLKAQPFGQEKFKVLPTLDSEGLIDDEKKIEEIILTKIRPNTEFHLDELVVEFNLDLGATVRVLKKLEDRGVVNG